MEKPGFCAGFLVTDRTAASGRLETSSRLSITVLALAQLRRDEGIETGDIAIAIEDEGPVVIAGDLHGVTYLDIESVRRQHGL